jgi:hypothetical protein
MSTPQQNRSLHYASLRSAPVGMMVFLAECDSPDSADPGSRALIER